MGKSLAICGQSDIGVEYYLPSQTTHNQALQSISNSRRMLLRARFRLPVVVRFCGLESAPGRNPLVPRHFSPRMCALLGAAGGKVCPAGVVLCEQRRWRFEARGKTSEIAAKYCRKSFVGAAEGVRLVDGVLCARPHAEAAHTENRYCSRVRLETVDSTVCNDNGRLGACSSSYDWYCGLVAWDMPQARASDVVSAIGSTHRFSWHLCVHGGWSIIIWTLRGLP